MDLSIKDLRVLLGQFFFDFSKFLDEKEHDVVCHLRCDSPTCSSFSDGSYQVTPQDIDNQEILYNKLDVYIKLLQELAKCRPLPF